MLDLKLNQNVKFKSYQNFADTSITMVLNVRFHKENVNNLKGEDST
jgi:hypothetical protein